MERSQRGEIENIISEVKSLSDNLTVKTSLWEKNLWILISSNLSHERDELKTSHGALKDSVYNLTQKTSQLEKVEDILTALKDNLTLEMDQLQAQNSKFSCNRFLSLHYYKVMRSKCKSGISFFVFIFSIVTDGIYLCHYTERTQCPANWIMFDSSCYLISTSKKTWYDSQTNCERQNASLVVISTFLEEVS